MSWTNFVFPFMRFFRGRRLKTFVKAYPDLASLSVLDIGGRPFIWELLKKHYGLIPKRLILLNTEYEVNLFEGFEKVIGDGRKLPYSDKCFDLIFSNSVIEHMGSKYDMLEFANECCRVGKKIYIQTPNFWFPVETHIVTVFIHWLPRHLYQKLSFLSCRYLSLRKNKTRFYQIFEGINLLTRRQLQELFAHKIISTERFFGLAKSLVVSDRKL